MNVQDQRKIDFYKQVFEELPNFNSDRHHKSQKHAAEKAEVMVKSSHEEEEHLS